MPTDQVKLASIRSFITSAINARKGEGMLKHLRKFRDPLLNSGKKQINLPKSQTVTEGGKLQMLRRGIKTSVGNTADNLYHLSKDVRGKGLIGGSQQAAKNVGTVWGKQLKSSLRKEIIPDAKNPLIVVNKNGKQYAKSKWAYGSDREIEAFTNRGSAIVRRKKLYDPISITAGASAPVIGGTMYAFGDKTQSKKKRAGEAALDTALFTVSTPLAIGSMIPRAMLEKNKIKKK